MITVRKLQSMVLFGIGACAIVGLPASAQNLALPSDHSTATSFTVVQATYSNIKVDGLNIAYRETGDPASPKLVLLHIHSFYRDAVEPRAKN